MSNYKFVKIVKSDDNNRLAELSIKTPFVKNMSEWAVNEIAKDVDLNLDERTHISGFKIRSYQTNNIIIHETNWELVETGQNEFTPKQP